MNRRSFMGLIAAAPVAITAAPAVVCELPELARCAGMPIGGISEKMPEISMEEMEERYFRPYCEAMEREWIAAERNGTAWWLPPDMQRKAV